MAARRRLPPLAVLAALAGTVVFVLLTILVSTGTAVGTVDDAVRRAVARHHNDVLVGLAVGVTDLLSPPVVAGVLVVGAAVVSRNERRLMPLVTALVVVTTVSLAILALKQGIARPGPGQPHPPATGGSFPSGHTAGTLVFLGTLALFVEARRPALGRRLTVAVVAVTFVVAVALVYADFHWLSDTVASIALGAAMLGLLCVGRVRAALIDPGRPVDRR